LLRVIVKFYMNQLQNRAKALVITRPELNKVSSLLKTARNLIIAWINLVLMFRFIFPINNSQWVTNSNHLIYSLLKFYF